MIVVRFVIVCVLNKFYIIVLYDLVPFFLLSLSVNFLRWWVLSLV